MYKHVLVTVMCAVFMVVAIAHFNTRVYAFSFDAGVEEVTVSGDEGKAEMFANIIEANAARYVPSTTEDSTVLGESFDLEDTDYYAIEAVRVHAEPSTDSAILGVVYVGEQVTVQSIEGDWCSIEWDGSTAFVHRNYLERI